ncbi:jg4969 [Pararge aegeria aegeria]|uniref:Jg4969 protein n=1 Tax=Pararge aegeria aegeria TaxID=348720 RepID=A0A8S4SH41_9NEOP|nr:jg4969 [Pararge aegeria aegeria]
MFLSGIGIIPFFFFFEQCVLPVMADLWLRNMNALYGPHKKAQSHSAGDGESYAWSISNKIRNLEIRQRTRVTEITQPVAKPKWQWAGHIVQRMDVGVPRCWNGSPALVNAARSTPDEVSDDISASQVAVGIKRHKTVEFGTPYKRPMSSCGRLSVDMMMKI